MTQTLSKGPDSEAQVQPPTDLDREAEDLFGGLFSNVEPHEAFTTPKKPTTPWIEYKMKAHMTNLRRIKNNPTKKKATLEASQFESKLLSSDSESDFSSQQLDSVKHLGYFIESEEFKVGTSRKNKSQR